MKYIFLKLNMQSEALSFYDCSIHEVKDTTDTLPYVEEYVRWLNEDITKDNLNSEEDYESGIYVDDPEEIILEIWVRSVNEITEEEYKILSKYL